jgi:hypothetical protein
MKRVSGRVAGHAGGVGELDGVVVDDTRLHQQVHRQRVHRVEVLRVDGVDHHHAGVTVLHEGVAQRGVHLVVLQLGHVGQRLTRGGARPDPHQAVLLAGRPGRHRRMHRLVAARDVHAAAGAVELPVVEEAAQAVAVDRALAEVRAHVRAVRVEAADLAVLAAEQHQLAARQAQGAHLAARQLGRAQGPVPALDQPIRAVEGLRVADSLHNAPGSSRT